MQNLILHPTSTAQWHSLLMDAQQSAAISLTESLEAYLVFLLMRFSDNPQLASSVLGLDFLVAYQQLLRRQRYDLLKEVGDKCLLFAGLFPQRAVKRRVKISYFVKLGQSAYFTACHSASSNEPLFHELCLEFPKLMDVLQAMRETSSGMSLLQSFELWNETGSQAAWQRLCEATQAIPISIINQNKSKN